MDRRDFLEGLRLYLATELSEEMVQNHINYYERYITEEVIKGRREESVVEELGDPWVIAKTILDMEDVKNEREDDYEANEETVYNNGNVRSFRFDTWWKKLILMLIVVGILMIVISLLTGLISLLVPIIVPVLLVTTVYRLFTRRRG